MPKRLLKLITIVISSIIVLIFAALLLIRIYSPDYFVPYLIEKVHEETKGRYTLSINSDSVKVHLISMSLNLGASELKRDTTVEDYSGIPLLDKFDVSVRLESIKINSFRLLSLLLNKKIIIDAIQLNEPNITIRKNIHYHPESDSVIVNDSISDLQISYDADSLLADTLAWEEFHDSRDAATPYIRFNNFSIEGASFAFYDGRKSKPIQEVYGLDFKVKRFVSDEYDDIEVEDALIHIDSASSLVSKNLARLTLKGLNIHPDSIHLDYLHFGHIVNRYSLNRIKGFRASWLNVDVKDIDINGIHPGKLISDSVLNIDNTSIGYVNLYLFKDKEEPVISPAYKSLPTEKIRNIPMALLIDTVDIKDGDFIIDMEAAKAVAPGRLTINNINGQIFNITNLESQLEQNSIMEFNSKFRIDDSIKVSLNYQFDLSSPEDAYTAKCDVQSFHASLLNEFLGSQFFIEFPKGNIDGLHFEFTGNNKVNVGTMDLEYQNLNVRKLQDYDKYLEGKPNTGFVTGIGNILIPNNRSTDDKNYKSAVIYYEKEYNRDVIHCTIMSMVSGITSSLGFASRNLEKKESQASQLDENAIQKSAEKAQEKADKAEQKKVN